jgi:hypothetical protein
MNCLECSLSPAIDSPMAAVAGCAYCGAGVCLDHARVLMRRSQPVGVMPDIRGGGRRIACTTCCLAGRREGFTFEHEHWPAPRRETGSAPPWHVA